MIFEVYFVEDPKPIDAEDNGTMEKIVMGPIPCVAKNEGSAIAQATFILTESKSAPKYARSRLRTIVKSIEQEDDE